MLVSYASKIVRVAKSLNEAIEAIERDNGVLPHRKKIGQIQAKFWHKNRARDRFQNKDTVPRAAPREFEPLMARTEQQIEELKEMLYALGNVVNDEDIGMTPDEVLLIIDSGSSRTIVNSLDDFVGQVYPVQNTTIKGISAGLTAKGIGTVAYTIKDDDGNDVRIEIKDALYVPECPVRLICPQQMTAQTKNPQDLFGIKGNQAVLQIGEHTITIPYNEESNLPIIKTEPGCTRYKNFMCIECKPSVESYSATSESSIDASKRGAGILDGGKSDNLTSTQREMLKWHRKLSHRNFSYLKDLARKGIIPKKLANCDTTNLVCPDCKFGNQAKRAVDKKRRPIDEGDDKPGKGVSTDQLESGTPGLIPTTRGRRSKQRHEVATIMVDHFSRLVYAHMSKSTSATEALEAKAEFECFASRFGVTVESYRSDNGVFASQEFREAVGNSKQDLTLCGVGAHWQNGIVERYIGSITRWARTMLLHAMSKWPDVITAEFWPYALRQAINIHNATPQEGKDICPWTLFTDEKCPWNASDFQVFGCPVYVLAKELQDGNNVQKWQSRSRLGVYVGQSTKHSGNVALVLNPETLHVSPQYHVVFDNGFTTVSPGKLATTKAKMDTVFAELFQSERWSYSDEYEEEPGHYHFEATWDPQIDHDQEESVDEPMASVIGPPNGSLWRLKSLCVPDASSQPQIEQDRPTKRAKNKHEGKQQPKASICVGPGLDEPLVDPVCKPEGASDETPAYEKGDKVIIANQYEDTAISATKIFAQKRDIAVQTMTSADDTQGTPDASDNIEQTLAAVQYGMAAQEMMERKSTSCAGAPIEDKTLPSSHPPSQVAVTEQQLQTRRRPSRGPSSRGTANAPFFPKRSECHPKAFSCGKKRRKDEKEKASARLPSYPKDDTYGQNTKRNRVNETFHALFTEIEQLEASEEYDTTSAQQARIFANMQTVDDGSENGTFNIDNPLVFNTMLNAMNNKEDILTQGDMLKAPDREKFLDAQAPELEGLQDMEVFEFVKTKDLPPETKLLNAIWSYRRKRQPDGTLLKYKARLCADGSKQKKGIDFTDSFAPVVAWSTVRLVLIMAALLGLKSRQIDFTQAFPQAECTDETYMKLPAGWTVNDPDSNEKYCLRLKRNLYGTCTASKNWYDKIAAGLVARGFHQSKIDPCLFLRNDCMLVIYTDDCICFSKETETAKQLIKDLKDDDFLLKDEGDAMDFLGVRIKTTSDNGNQMIIMTQTGLIELILTDLGLSKCKIKQVPASEILHPDKTGADRIEAEKWKYRSVIGKMNYLAMNTRPDIAFAVHQCAKYCNNPKLLHEKAVKHIGKYLAATRDKGIILWPTANGQLDAYVDADFAGRWHQKYAQLRESVLSRTGYVITYCGCPVTWSSKLQTEIALSTTESEYIALSSMMRTLLPMRSMLKEINKHSLQHLTISQTTAKMTRIRTLEVYEDNTGCIVLATTDKYRPRTKHLAIKWHHFKDQVKNGNVKVTKVDTSLNWADIFTKPLPKLTFETIRKLLMGW